MQQETKNRLSNSSLWKRALYMLIFSIIRALAESVVTLVAIFQFLILLVTGSANEPLLKFGTNLSTFIYQIMQFLTFNSEEYAFPFSDWPDEQYDVNNCWIDQGDEFEEVEEVDEIDEAESADSEEPDSEEQASEDADPKA
jgi:hypothetical protein